MTPWSTSPSPSPSPVTPSPSSYTPSTSLATPSSSPQPPSSTSRTNSRIPVKVSLSSRASPAISRSEQKKTVKKEVRGRVKEEEEGRRKEEIRRRKEAEKKKEVVAVELWQIQQRLGRGDFIEGILRVRGKSQSSIHAPVSLSRGTGQLHWRL